MKNKKIVLLLGILPLTLALLSACNSQSQVSASIKEQQISEAELDSRLLALIKSHQLTGKPVADHPIPDISSPKAQLGMKLFYTKTLGGDNTTACATCHHPMLGGGDNLSLSIGTDSKKPDVLGSQRRMIMDKHPGVPRNAPTTFNIAFWKKALFHDARIERISDTEIHTPDVSYPKADSLAGETLVQAQARFPITSPDEMRGNYLDKSYNQTLRRALASRLKKNWLNEFRLGFNAPKGSAEDLITEQNFSAAIADYERSQVFINTPWKSYIEGDKQALSVSAKKGALLFYASQDQGGAGCASCHSGDFFTNELAYNTAMPQIGPGKNVGVTGTNDYGCYEVTQKEDDKFQFRTPTLLNVEVTGPWGHNGAYTSLEAITQHMLAPVESAKAYQTDQIKQQGIDITDVKKNTQEAINANVDIIRKETVDKKDVKHLVSFLKSLTDPCVKDRACLSKWIPNKNDNDPDGLMLHARGSEDGKLL